MTRRDLGRVVAIELATFGREAWPLQAFKDLLSAFSQAKPARGALWVAADPRTGEILGYAGAEVSALLRSAINHRASPRPREGILRKDELRRAP